MLVKGSYFNHLLIYNSEYLYSFRNTLRIVSFNLLTFVFLPNFSFD